MSKKENKNKEGTPEHKNALAEALKKVASPPNPLPKEKGVEEVPEDVLRKVLNGSR